jgi:hypothetical protein
MLWQELLLEPSRTGTYIEYYKLQIIQIIVGQASQIVGVEVATMVPNLLVGS